jgi:hypothetical protein
MSPSPYDRLNESPCLRPISILDQMGASGKCFRIDLQADIPFRAQEIAQIHRYEREDDRVINMIVRGNIRP